MKLVALNEEIAKREEAEEAKIRKHELDEDEADRHQLEQEAERIKHIQEEKKATAKRLLDDLKSKEEIDCYVDIIIY